MIAPSITKNLFKLKKVMKNQKQEDDSVGATGQDIESILSQINLQPEQVEGNENIEINPLRHK